MFVTLKLVVVLIVIRYHFSFVFCQSQKEPTIRKHARKSEIPIRSFRNHWRRKELDVNNDEHLKDIVSQIKQPETRLAQQWQAAVKPQLRSKDRLSKEVQVGNPRLNIKMNHPSGTIATVVVDKENQKKEEAKKRSPAEKVSAQTISRKRNHELKANRNDGYYGNKNNVEDYIEPEKSIKHYTHGKDVKETNVNKGDAKTVGPEYVGIIGKPGEIKPKGHNVNIQYALNVRLNKKLGDYIRNKVTVIKDKIGALRSSGLTYLK